jgi:hypothetical protein
MCCCVCGQCCCCCWWWWPCCMTPLPSFHNRTWPMCMSPAHHCCCCCCCRGCCTLQDLLMPCICVHSTPSCVGPGLCWSKPHPSLPLSQMPYSGPPPMLSVPLLFKAQRHPPPPPRAPGTHAVCPLFFRPTCLEHDLLDHLPLHQLCLLLGTAPPPPSNPGPNPSKPMQAKDP